MTFSASTKLALRSLGRNTRRTALSILGIGIGVALALVTLSFERGQGDIYILAAAEGGAGHLRVVPQGWQERHDIRLRMTDWQAPLEAIRALPEVKVATPRIRAQALLAMGTRTVGVELVGVDPSSEPGAFRFVRKLSQGRYLVPGDQGAAVVGAAVARRLDAGLDDEIVVTVTGNGAEMISAILHIVGIVETGSQNLDASICHVMLEDLAGWSNFPGIGEITILSRRQRGLESLVSAIAPLAPPRSEVLTWRQVVPEFQTIVDVNAALWQLTVGFVVLVVLIGVTSAQLAAVLERRADFAVLMAIGMGGGKVVRMLIVEALALGAAGGAVALLLGAPGALYLATHGFDMTPFWGEDVAFFGVRFDPILYGDFGLWLIPYSLILSWVATVLASFYPALFATRTDPAEALRVSK